MLSVFINLIKMLKILFFFPFFAFGFLLSITSTYAASNGEEAYNAYVRALNSLGLQIEAASLEYDADSDILTIRGGKFSIDGRLPGEQHRTDQAKDNASNEVTFEASYEFDRCELHGFTNDGNLFTAELVKCLRNTIFSAKILFNEKIRASLFVHHRNTETKNYSIKLSETERKQDFGSLRSYLPVLKYFFQPSFDEHTSDFYQSDVFVHLIDGDDETFLQNRRSTFSGLRVLNSVLGDFESVFIESQIHDRVSQLGQEEYQVGQSEYHEVKLGSLLNFLDQPEASTGQKLTFVSSATETDLKTSVDLSPNGTARLRVDQTKTHGHRVTMRDVDIYTLIYEALVPQDWASENAWFEYFQTDSFHFQRNQTLDGISFSGIEIDVKNRETKKRVQIGIDQFAVRNLSSDGFSEISMSGLNIPELPEGGSVKLDMVAFRDVEFTDYETMRPRLKALASDPDTATENPYQVLRAFAPTSFRFEVNSAEIDDPAFDRTRIGRAEITFKPDAQSTKTTFSLRYEDMHIPVARVANEDVRRILRGLGHKNLEMSQQAQFTWDWAARELSIDGVTVRVKGLGETTAKGRLANLPEGLFEDPLNRLNFVLAEADFVDASLHFKEGGLVSERLPWISDEQGLPIELLHDVVIAQAAAITAPIQNEAFTKMVSDAASKFLNDPKDLKITLTPPNPVPLAQILGSMAAPQTLPDLLNVQIEAN